MVRKIAIAVIAVALLTVAGVLAVQHNNEVQKSKEVAAQRASQAAQVKAKEAQDKHNAQVADIKRVVGECERVRSAWATLPKAVTVKVAPPNCALTVPVE